MKKILFYLVSAALLAGTVSCKKEDAKKEEGKQTATVEVYSPDDMEEFDLNWDNPNKKLTFEWEDGGDGVQYSILFSLSDDMSDATKLDAGTECTKDVTHLDLDNCMEELGVGAYKRATLYWSIEGEGSNKSVTSEVRSMDLFRFYKPFVDPRDGESYRVIRIMDEMTGDYAVWMADNLRATKYSDGTPLTSSEVDFYDLKAGESSDLVKVYGGYYTWTAVMRGTVGAETGQKIQGIAPDGWHIPTQDEWVFLINMCPDNTRPGTCLKDPAYWNTNDEQYRGQNSIGFNMAGAGYARPVGQGGFVENGLNTYFWTATAPKAGDVFPWNPPASEFPNQGVTYGFFANDHGAALYPYYRTDGFNVRCVLD